MTGFPGFGSEFIDGWFIDNTDGVSTIYLSLVDEGITTSASDTPSSKVFRPRIKNADKISIRRAPMVWPWGDTNGQMAAFSHIEIDNYDGAYDSLLTADLRDSTVILKVPVAGALLGPSAMANAPVVATAVLDSVEQSKDRVITLTLKDTMARLDRSLPVRINPPFVATAAANRMVPVTFGACRNVEPLMVDEPERLFQIHDAPIKNIVAAKDMAAPLDPHSTPPQYVPAISNSGVQLQTLTVGKFTVDCSSVGAQATIPGADDVLDGDGEFATWDSEGVPEGWSWSGNAGSSLTPKGTAQGYPVDYVAEMKTSTVWLPVNNKFGDYLVSDEAILETGKAYRITCKVHSTFANPPVIPDERMRGGLRVRAGLDGNPQHAISSDDFAITVPQFGNQSYVFDYRVPAPTLTYPATELNLYLIACATRDQSGNAYGTGTVRIYDVKVEELGEFIELPMQGITLKDYFTEILVNRAGEDASIFNATDLQTLDAEIGHTFGIHFDEAPNILEALQKPLDSFGPATRFTDVDGVIRVKRMRDPYDGDIKVAFNIDNNPVISVEIDTAENLTTQVGSRTNWSQFTSDADFVTDTVVVPLDVKVRYKRRSQFLRTSGIVPASFYAGAMDAPAFESLFDEPEPSQELIDRVVKMYSPQFYPDGTFHNGLRRFVGFSIPYDTLDSIGTGTTCAVTDLMFGDIVTLTSEKLGFDAVRMVIVAWEIFPIAKRVELVCHY